MISWVGATVLVDDILSRLILANVPVAGLAFALLAGFHWPQSHQRGRLGEHRRRHPVGSGRLLVTRRRWRVHLDLGDLRHSAHLPHRYRRIDVDASTCPAPWSFLTAAVHTRARDLEANPSQRRLRAGMLSGRAARQSCSRSRIRLTSRAWYARSAARLRQLPRVVLQVEQLPVARTPATRRTSRPGSPPPARRECGPCPGPWGARRRIRRASWPARADK